MSYVSESIPDLLGGVSQLAPQRREANEVEEMVNCMLRPAEGVVKRPPTVFVAQVAPSATPFSGAFVHPINKNVNERFWVIVLDGDLKVFDAVTGVEATVTFPDGKSYLNVTGTPNESFRLATFNQTTVIVNREITVGRSAELSDTRGEEGLIVIQQGDFATLYQAQIVFYGPPFGQQSTGLPIAEYLTPNAAPENQFEINTTEIAKNLATAINDKWGDGTGNQNLLTVRRFGSVIHITPGPNLQAGARFWMRTFDGLANLGSRVIQGSVQSISELPTEAPVGFRIKIEGDPDKKLDDVFYEFTDTKTWRETTADNIPIALDPATLPLELTLDPNFVEGIEAQVPVATLQAAQANDSSDVLLQTLDGTPSTAAEAKVEAAPGAFIDRFMNLASANSSDINFHLSMNLDETRVIAAGIDPTDPAGGYYGGDSYTLEVALDTGAGFVVVDTLPFFDWAPAARRFNKTISLSSVPANSDLRFRLSSAAGNLGALIMTYDLSMTFSTVNETRINTLSPHYAPNTAMSFTLNGTAFSDTFVAGGDQSAYMTNLKTVIEAYGGPKAVTVTIKLDPVTNKQLGFITIANNDGSEPTLTAFTFDNAIDETTQLFNGGVDFVTLGVSVSDTIRNTTDRSSATVTVVATTVITHGALSGGVNDLWSNGDNADVKNASQTFSCRQADWAKRTVGTEDTNKWPSFDDEKINEVAFLKNRLIFLSDENVAMSEVDSFFNFFRTSTIDVLDSDRIDVSLSGSKTSSLHSAFEWNETLLTWSELGQFVVNGEPFLSPNTVRREATTSYVNTRKVKPVSSERAVYFLSEGKEFVQLWRYRPTSNDATSAEADRLSIKVPRFMPGAARGLLAVSDPEIVLVLTDTNPDKLYVYSHLRVDEKNLMAGWHEWSFDGVTNILGIGSIDNEVSLIFERDDGTVTLEVLDVWELSDLTVDGQVQSNDLTPPVFNPTSLSLRALDTFTEAANAKVSAHTPDTSPGGVGWLINAAQDLIGSGGIYIDGPLDRLRANNAASAGIPQIRINAADTYLAGGGTDLEVFADFSWSANQNNNNELMVHCLAATADLEAGLRLRVADISSTNVSIAVDAATATGATETTNFPTADAVGGIITVSASRAHATGDITVPARYGMRVAGDILTVFAADAVTGANEVTLYTGTLVALWKTAYRTALYTYYGCKPSATVFQTAYLDNFSYSSGNATPGTTYTVPINGSFPIIIGIDPNTGEEVILVDNGDGTVTWPTDDKTGINVYIGLPVKSRIVLSPLFHKKDFGPFAGQPEIRGNTYINNLQIGIQDTSALSADVQVIGSLLFTQDLVERRSLDAEYMHVVVGGRNTETTITIRSDTAVSFKIAGFDWEGMYYNRTRRSS